jgi:hypothetical protein
LQFVPAPGVHADLALPTAFAAPHQQRAAALVEIGLGERERFLGMPPTLRTPPDTTGATPQRILMPVHQP